VIRRGPNVVLCSIVAAIVAVTALPRAHADARVDELTKTLTTSSSDKTRLAAVVALAKLGDKRALKPLVTALHDPSPEVRATAAVALGHLGHKAALPSLRDLAANDPDDGVRAKAKTAAKLVARANHLPDQVDDKPAQVADDSSTTTAKTTTATTTTQAQERKAGFGRNPHAVEQHPDLYIVVKTSSDDSPGSSSKETRKTHGDIVRNTLVGEFGAQPSVTLAADEASKWGLDARQVDLSVIKLEVTTDGPYVEIEAQLRLAISDDTGKMQSFLSGGAKVSVAKAKYDAKLLPELRKEALENAMRGMFDKLLAHLRKTSA
jgi:hypothetical protein